MKLNEIKKLTNSKNSYDVDEMREEIDTIAVNSDQRDLYGYFSHVLNTLSPKRVLKLYNFMKGNNAMPNQSGAQTGKINNITNPDRKEIINQ